MGFLGYSRESGAIYVGESTSFGYRTPQDPFLTPFRLSRNGEIRADEANDMTFHLAKRVFREIYFDPVTRVRRGDVFLMEGNQPGRWLAQDPYRKDLGNAFKAEGSRYHLELITYQHDRLAELAHQLGKPACPRVILGRADYSTFWKIISVEASVSNAPVLTLKAEQYFGDMPEIISRNVPERIRPNLETLLDDIGSSIHRLSPVAVIDRCRDCLSLIFGEMVQQPGADLGAAIAAWVKLKEGKEDVRSRCGWIVARFHSRGKPNEQLVKKLRPLTESDAQMAVRCLWTVLVEFGWAR
ncbi:MAG: hypothetical protein JWM32_3100 [Verrucomicrobia bacterium]|nr:hypothetical protein [Verrucomicrobiota bacterium]